MVTALSLYHILKGIRSSFKTCSLKTEWRNIFSQANLFAAIFFWHSDRNSPNIFDIVNKVLKKNEKQYTQQLLSSLYPVSGKGDFLTGSVCEFSSVDFETAGNCCK